MGRVSFFRGTGRKAEIEVRWDCAEVRGREGRLQAAGGQQPRRQASRGDARWAWGGLWVFRTRGMVREAIRMQPRRLLVARGAWDGRIERVVLVQGGRARGRLVQGRRGPEVAEHLGQQGRRAASSGLGQGRALGGGRRGGQSRVELGQWRSGGEGALCLR